MSSPFCFIVHRDSNQVLTDLWPLLFSVSEVVTNARENCASDDRCLRRAEAKRGSYGANVLLFVHAAFAGDNIRRTAIFSFKLTGQIPRDISRKKVRVVALLSYKSHYCTGCECSPRVCYKCFP